MCIFESSEIRTPPYTGQLTVVPMVSLLYGFTVQDSLLWSKWCPYYRGFTVQDCLLWSQWCPYYRGFTVQDCLLWSQWCPYYRGFTVQDSILWSQWCPYYRGSTVHVIGATMSCCACSAVHTMSCCACNVCVAPIFSNTGNRNPKRYYCV